MSRSQRREKHPWYEKDTRRGDNAGKVVGLFRSRTGNRSTKKVANRATRRKTRTALRKESE
jgi:hypothetical protein